MPATARGAMRTELTQRVSLQYPLIQAPIGSASTPQLAAAVSNAGGLGSLAVTWRSPAELRWAIRRTSRLTSRPFAVNVILTSPQEFRIRTALEAGARIIWTFWGDPAPHVDPVHDAGGILLHTVGSPEEARAAAAAGVDVLVAQGVEAGGHVRGATPWRELLERIREEVPGTPVVVAGGIADGREVAEALSLGAAGACLGTRFVCSEEAASAEVYRKRIVEAKEGDTVLVSLFNKGWADAPHRVLRNSTVRAWEAAGEPAPGFRPGEFDQLAEDRFGGLIERYSDVIPVRGMRGRLEALALYAGVGSARIRDVLPAEKVVKRLVRQIQRA